MSSIVHRQRTYANLSRTDFFRVVAGIEGVHVETQLLEAFRHVDIEAVLRLIFLPKEEGRPIYITSNMITSSILYYSTRKGKSPT